MVTRRFRRRRDEPGLVRSGWWTDECDPTDKRLYRCRAHGEADVVVDIAEETYRLRITFLDYSALRRGIDGIMLKRAMSPAGEPGKGLRLRHRIPLSLDYDVLRALPTATILTEIDDLLERAAIRREFGKVDLGRKTASAELDEYVLAQIAGMYCRLQRGGRSPVKRLAEILDVPPAKATRHVLHARQHGLLTSPGRGRVGGELTDKARQLLEPDEGTIQ